MIGLVPGVTLTGVPDVETTPPSIITSVSGVKSGCRAFNRIWIGILMIKAKNKAKTFPGIAKLWRSNGAEQENKQTKGVKTMDAVEFLRDFRRMCSSYGSTCAGCELEYDLCETTRRNCNHEKVIRIVEKWAKEHPVKTRLEAE